ncbi:hypothetical protein ABEB36_002454 [Hypothenemus hampei]
MKNRENQRIRFVARKKLDDIRESLNVKFQNEPKNYFFQANLTLTNTTSFVQLRNSFLCNKHYVCIFTHDCTAYITKLGVPDRDGILNFDDQFQFKIVDSNFDIQATLYSIRSPKTFAYICSCFKKKPSMKMVGEVHITMKNVRRNKLILQHPDFPTDAENNCWLSTKIEVKPKWPPGMKGKLKIAIIKNKIPGNFNLRWCIMENGYFKCYKYVPSKYSKSLVDELNLRKCTKAKKVYRSNKKMIKLEIVMSVCKKTVFLETDNDLEFNAWLKKIKNVMDFNKLWKKVDADVNRDDLELSIIPEE